MTTRRVMHFDRLELQLDGGSLRELPGGAISVKGTGAHVGLYTYHDDKGRPFVELVPRETLFDERSLASVREGAPDVTIRHPSGLVTADNWRDTSHGVWLDAWPSGDELGVKLLVKSVEGVAMVRDAIDAGVPVELSPGYEVDVVDAPGVSEHGRHDAIQRDRVYNHIALLGPGEARGGSGMRLQLDGPVCAPPGCRIQSHRVRHDGPRGTKLMKFKIKHKDGKTVELDGARFGWLRAMSFDAKAVNTDQIETGKVTIEVEGEPPTELMLPLSMIEMMLEGIGGAAPAAAPEGMEETPEMAESPEDAMDEPRGDSKLTLDAIARLIDRKLGAHTKQQRQIDARDSEVQANARRLNVDATDGRHWTQVSLDAITKASPEASKRAGKLAMDAKKGDAVAEGMLRELLRQTADAAGEPGSGGLVPGRTITPTEKPKHDSTTPWDRGEPNHPKGDGGTN